MLFTFQTVAAFFFLSFFLHFLFSVSWPHSYQSGSVRHVPSLDSISCAVDGLHMQVTHFLTFVTTILFLLFSKILLRIYCTLCGQKYMVIPFHTLLCLLAQFFYFQDSNGKSFLYNCRKQLPSNSDELSALHPYCAC